VAGILIGAVYLWPAALSARVQDRFTPAFKVLLIILAAALALTVAGILADNAQLLSIMTPVFVVSLAATGALAIGKLARFAWRRIRSTSTL
jgi:hypothetical protein